MRELNAQQTAAVVTNAKQVLVTATPGAGKTTVLVEHVKHMISQGIEPRTIVAITFTRHAAAELRTRIGDAGRMVVIGTLHSFCLRLIREMGQSIGYQWDWLTIEDDEDSLLEQYDALTDLGIMARGPDGRRVWKLCKAKDWEHFVEQVTAGLQDPESDKTPDLFRQAWAAYMDRLRSQNTLTYGTILTEAYRLLQDRKALAIFRRKYRHFLIDECFPAGTPVLTSEGWMPIEQIVEGQSRDIFVATQDTTGVEWAHVKTAYKTKRRTPIVRVDHEHGSLYCTTEHPFVVDGERVPAVSLRTGSRLSMVQARVESDRNTSASQKVHDGDSVLQLSQSPVAELHEGPSGCQKGIQQTERNEASPYYPWGKRDGNDEAAVSAFEVVGGRMGRRACCPYWTAEKRRSSNPLQARHRQPIQNGGNRSEREQPSINSEATFGRAEDWMVAESRVVRVVVLEQGSPELSKLGAAADFVYTLEVEHDAHNYFAAGVCVGNCQDTSNLQWSIVFRLVAKARPDTFFAVGDLDQSLYSWRGAAPEYMLKMARNPKTTCYTLPTSYRFGPGIAAPAQRLIDHNKARLPTKIETVTEVGNTVFSALSTLEAVRAAVRENSARVGPSNVAVLSRRHKPLIELEHALTVAGIPCRRIGKQADIRRSYEFRVCMSYIRCAANPRDRRAFARIATLDGISAEQMRGFRQRAAEGVPIASLWFSANFPAPWRPEEIEERVKDRDREHDYAAAIGLLREAILFQGLNSPADLDRWFAFSDIQDELAAVPSEESVTLCTVHAAKGLEWHTVIVIDVCEGVWPSGGSLKEGREEEERRLLYVAMTRAREHLVVVPTICADELRLLEPSRFIAEATGETATPSERDKIPVDSGSASDDVAHMTNDTVYKFNPNRGPAAVSAFLPGSRQGVTAGLGEGLTSGMEV